MLGRVIGWVSGLLLCMGAQAAAITSTYAPLGGDLWSVAFDVQNNGSPPSISGFTVFFDETLFGSLSLTTNPSTWDSLLVQPDPAIPGAGFLDAQVINAADELAVGASIGGWTVEFQYLGAGRPGALPFDIVDRNFNVLQSGLTAVSLPVSEPGTAALLAAALLAGSTARRRRAGR